MSCCGQQRRAFSAEAFRSPSSDYAYFQYTGRTGLTVRAPNTGSRYRFDKPGSTVAVDPQDRRALAAVPQLTQVRRPQ